MSDNLDSKNGSENAVNSPIEGPSEVKPLLDTPVAIENRIDSVDTLRGFALLGILVINIGMLALSQIAINNPAVVGNDTGANLAVWSISRVFFFQKFMAIFSMLFGAGLIMMYERAEATGRDMGKTYFRRLRWLMVFGLIHGYLIWWGDILFNYAVSGMILYPMRRMSSRRLITIGVIVFFIGCLFFFGLGLFLDFCRDTANAGYEARAAGEELTSIQESMIQIWENADSQMNPSPDVVEKQTESFRGGYLDMVLGNAFTVLSLQTIVFVLYIMWRTVGLMLIGMGLMKLGIFSGIRPKRLYWSGMLVGYGLGLPLAAYLVHIIISSDFDMLKNFGIYTIYDSIAVLLVTTGHIGLVMFFYQSGILKSILTRLAAVGRMALTNYLMHSIILAPIFFGYGFGLYGKIGFFGLMGFVLAIWILQLLLSPWWLKRFRFGPAEWLWRSLTYRKKQPMRVNQSG